MKFISTLAIAAALDVRASSKAPHQKLLQVTQDSMQYYENKAEDFITAGYSWEVVGDVKLSGVAQTFASTGPAAQAVVTAANGWASTLRQAWLSTLMRTAMANGLYTVQATVGASRNYTSNSSDYSNSTSNYTDYSNSSDYSNSTSNSSDYSNSSDNSNSTSNYSDYSNYPANFTGTVVPNNSLPANASLWQNPCSALNATGCCYGNYSGDSHDSNGGYCHYDNRAQCLDDRYGGVNYGCTWNVIPTNSTPVKLELVSASDSGVDPRWPWAATKLLSGRVQPNIGDRATQTCTHSNFTAGNWQEVGLAGNATITTIKIMGRSDCCQSRQYGDKVYAGETLCGTWPEGDANGWITFDCPAGTVASDVKIVQPRATALTICGVEVYGNLV